MSVCQSVRVVGSACQRSGEVLWPLGGYNYDIGRMITGVELSYDRLAVKTFSTDDSMVALRAALAAMLIRCFPCVIACFVSENVHNMRDNEHS